jgi:hypothetical protein
MKISNQAEISIRDRISTTELLIIHILTENIIMITGTQITTQEFRRNLHLIIACLNNHLKVSHRLEKARLMLFITASQAEQSFSMI